MLSPFTGLHRVSFLNTGCKRSKIMRILSSPHFFFFRKERIRVIMIVLSLSSWSSLPVNWFTSSGATPLVVNPTMIRPQNRYSFSFVVSAVRSVGLSYRLWWIDLIFVSNAVSVRCLKSSNSFSVSVILSSIAKNLSRLSAFNSDHPLSSSGICLGTRLFFSEI